jgi:hypothetical protein
VLPLGYVSQARAAGSSTQHVTVYLKPHNRAALQALARTPGLTWQERQRQLAGLRPTVADQDRVARVLRALGLKVTAQRSWSVTASAPATSLRGLFGSARNVAARSRVAHPLPTMPSSLRGLVTMAVGGDETRPSPARTHDWTGSSSPPNPGHNGTTVRSAYGTTAPSSNPFGLIVASVQLSNWNPASLSDYAAEVGIGNPLTNGQYTAVNVDGGPDNSDAFVEVALDQEALLGVAPTIRQRAYFGPISLDTFDGFLDAFYAIGDDAADPAIGPRLVAATTSWGFCEDPDPAYADVFAAYEDAMSYVVASGVTLFASSGDSGSWCQVSDTAFADDTVSYPASSPYVVGVGGSDLSLDGTTRESIWACSNEGPGPGCVDAATWCQQTSGCSGGGESALFGKPHWQSGRIHSPFRDVPDISAPAAPNHGYGIFAAPPGAPRDVYLTGGTSLSSPLSAGLLADELVLHNYPWGVGDIHQALYSAPAGTDKNGLARIAITDLDQTYLNGSYGTGPGYDVVTGLGVVNWDKFAPILLPTTSTPAADFTGDGRADIAVYRPDSGTWYVKGQASTRWGVPRDIPVPADYTGDHRADLTIFRPSSGTWYVKGQPAVRWGVLGDIPVPADFTGDGRADIAVYRPSEGNWYVKGLAMKHNGVPGDLPMARDFTGDGRADFAVFRPSHGTWYIKGQPSAGWGIPGDLPAPANFFGDGRAELTVYRPSEGTWYVKGQSPIHYGAFNDMPMQGNFVGNGFADVAVYRPSNGRWYVKGGGASIAWGIPGDVPL